MIDIIERLRIRQPLLGTLCDEAAAEIERLMEALIWCSASEDFQEGGQAREGWLKLCKPLIDAHVALAADEPTP